MQESIHEEQGIGTTTVEDQFLGLQESFAQAQQRALEENKTFARTEFFRLDKAGVYRIRILPLAPNPKHDRRGYEYPVHQLLMEIEKPAAGGKPSSMYVTVPRTTEAGYSIDLIDTYRKLAVAKAKDLGDDKLAEKIDGGSFGGGMKFNYGHAMYILDLNDRGKGIQLLTLSHSQFKDLDERKFRLWEKKLAKNPHYPCPICSVYNAYPVEIEKRKNGGKTEYITGIDNESDNDILSKEELTVLMNTPRIPEIIYRYSRYQFGATLEYLKQCDLRYGLQIMEADEMAQAVERLQGELPKEDTSVFSFDKRTKEAKDTASGSAISLDQLYDRYDELQGQKLGDKTEEGQELRARIRAYIEQESISVRITRATTNGELLEMIEDHLHNAGNRAEVEPQAQDEQVQDAAEDESMAPRRRR